MFSCKTILPIDLRLHLNQIINQRLTCLLVYEGPVVFNFDVFRSCICGAAHRFAVGLAKSVNEVVQMASIIVRKTVVL